MKPNNKEVGGNQMMVSEVKSLKERVKMLETDNKLLRSREVAATAPVVTTQEHNRVRGLLLNLLVAVENRFGGKPMGDGELKAAVESAGAFIRPAAPPPGSTTKVVIQVDRAE